MSFVGSRTVDFRWFSLRMCHQIWDRQVHEVRSYRQRVGVPVRPVSAESTDSSSRQQWIRWSLQQRCRTLSSSSFFRNSPDFFHGGCRGVPPRKRPRRRADHASSVIWVYHRLGDGSAQRWSLSRRERKLCIRAVYRSGASRAVQPTMIPWSLSAPPAIDTPARFLEIAGRYWRTPDIFSADTFCDRCTSGERLSPGWRRGSRATTYGFDSDTSERSRTRQASRMASEIWSQYFACKCPETRIQRFWI